MRNVRDELVAYEGMDKAHECVSNRRGRIEVTTVAYGMSGSVNGMERVRFHNPSFI